MRQGNSFAAPHITGIVALLREALPDGSPAVVRTALAANALECGQPSGSREASPVEGRGEPGKRERVSSERPTAEGGAGLDSPSGALPI